MKSKREFRHLKVCLNFYNKERNVGKYQTGEDDMKCKATVGMC